jgi:hypothetical protein
MNGIQYVLVYKKTGKVAGMDYNSGGYPFPTERISFFHFWDNPDGDLVKNYLRMFPELELKEFRWRVE